MGLETFLHCPISYPLLGWWAFHQVRKWKKREHGDYRYVPIRRHFLHKRQEMAA